jgi:IclR family mhp operon transcriptional activator
VNRSRLHRRGKALYELTSLVRLLSDGYKDEDWLRQAAMPVIKSLQQEVVWPTDLATFRDNAMYLRETTRRHGPLTIDRFAVGLRLPMLASATGRAYLANCDEAERKLILQNLKSSGRRQTGVE